MNILIIHYHLRAGGVTRVIESQAKILREQGHEVQIASSGLSRG
jgi:menaquinone-dependent protoporphyrinogen IX oxidase